jgi:very-short-patch-repair endonuclease
LDSPAVDAAARSLKHWRERLLDLSRRNPLLYFNSSRGTKIRITRPQVEKLYEAVVIREKSLAFPKPRTTNATDWGAPIPERSGVKGGTQELGPAEIPGDLSIDYSVSSAADVVELQRKLQRLWKNARVSLEELGVNTMHLALGMLEWREAEYAQSYEHSPLVLVPATLDLKKPDAFRLSCFEPDARLNPVLDFKLRTTYGVTLPSFDAYSGLDGDPPRLGEWLERVRQIVNAMGWRVTDEAWLSHFSFEKLVMYEDLGLPGTDESVGAHPVLGSMVRAREYEVNPVPAELSPPKAEAFDRAELFPVLNADSSQLQVLAEAASGNSLAVEGPPGTGKSQTIVNLIAQALRQGKSVLFVSEKRAALEVVHRHLRKGGLDRFCLELHSHRTQRASLVSQLKTELDRGGKPPDRVDEEEFEHRAALRRRLDEYVEQLHAPRGKSQLTAFVVQGQLAKLARAPDVDAPLPLRAMDISRRQEQEMRDVLRRIEAVGVWDRELDHPWRDSRPTGPSSIVAARIARDLEGCESAVLALVEIRSRLTESPCASLELSAIRDVRGLSTILQRLRGLPETVVGTARGSAGQLMASAVGTVASALAALLSDDDILARYQQRYSRWWRRLTPRYARDTWAIQRAVGRRAAWRDGLALLVAATGYRDVFRQLTEDRRPGPPPSGSFRDGFADARSLAIDILRFMGRLGQEGMVLPDELARKLVTNPVSVQRSASELSDALAEASVRLNEALPAVEQLFPSGMNGRALADIDLGDLQDRLRLCRKHLDLLDEWRSHVAALDQSQEMGLAPFLEQARLARVSGRDLEKTFLKLVSRRWLEDAYEESPSLRDFDRQDHERLIAEFRAIDRALIEKSHILVERAAYGRREPVQVATAFLSAGGRPTADRPDQSESIRRLKEQVRLLQREANKKRRHLPIRRLLPEVAELALLLKPCFLMSPLSVATYLPRDRFRFDLIIFDEASQVLPEDAVGAILRGEQVVIFGDTKQLPPTPFFRRLIDEEDETEEADQGTGGDAVIGFESILDLAKPALPVKTLRWHYRSKDERLIAFSNHRFYTESPLITFPSPQLSTDSTGVRLIVCREGRWERNVRRNLPEARLVVDLVMQHLERWSDRSLGVIALGLGQAEAIELELERRLMERPDLEARSEVRGERLFVKNLENVQGDERHEIIISIGYGPEQPGGRVPVRFGPINQTGGERRLNVAVTRARYRTTVVASFEPQALLRAAELREGPRYLHEYLLYAQREGREVEAPDGSGSGVPESEFEEAVKLALEARGYVVDAQVGQSGYRIDLAVRDPDDPERYVLAIECDGATYHSAAAVRDRDRLRQEQLEALGWRFHRIWSTDWIRDPDRAIERAIAAIEAARHQRPGISEAKTD